MSFFKYAPQVNGARRQKLPFAPERPEASGLRLAVPGAAVVVTLGLFGYALSSGTAGDQAPVQSLANAASTGEFSPGAGWISNFIALSGVFGRGSPDDWQASGGQLFAPVPQPSRLPQFAAASMMLSGTSDGRLALSTLAPGWNKVAASDLRSGAALSSLSIEFPGNSAKISAARMGTIKKAAELIKALPAGDEVDVIGYAAGSGSSHRALILAQRRANSVYKALVRAGVRPSMLRPKGLNGSRLEASAKSALEGRSSTETGAPQYRDRRVEFHVVEPQR
jgi:outer membrane protein OmpA-like peptidoglycan-associated protein